MITTDDPAIIWHDTHIVIDANLAACALFRCDRDWIIDKTILELVFIDRAEDGLEKLILLRMKALQEHGYLPEWYIPFIRADRTIFYADVRSTRSTCGCYQTVLRYKYEW
jgi:PAS domain-containing protein